MTCYLCTFLGGNTNTRDLALHLSVMYGLLTCSETGPESVLACWGSGRREVGYKAYSLPAIPEHNADSGEVPLGTCQTGEELHPPALQQRAPLPARNPPPLYVALMGHWGADDTEESALALFWSLVTVFTADEIVPCAIFLSPWNPAGWFNTDISISRVQACNSILLPHAC